MAKFKPYKIESSQLESLTKSEGQFIVTTDTQKVYLDETDSSRIELIPVPTKTSDLVNDMNFMSGMTILSYGHSTWNDFITAYTAKHVVYSRASSGSNPASGSQTRLAFMAYVNNADNPTEVEFQYYRSVSTHSDSQQGDQTYVYKLNKTNGWSVTVRENYTKVVAGTGMSSTWSGGKITLNCTVTPPTKTSDLTNDSGFIDNTVDDLTNYTKTSDLATVATSGDYDDLINKPTIPTVNNATLTIQKNGTTIKTFTANASTDVTANITVPTKTSDLTNDSSFATETYVTNTVEDQMPLSGRIVFDVNTESYYLQDLTYNDIAEAINNNRPIIITDDMGHKTMQVSFSGLSSVDIVFDLINDAAQEKYTVDSSNTVTRNYQRINVSTFPNDSGYITGITSSDVTTALGYTPYNSTNPNGYTTNTGTVTNITAGTGLTGGNITTTGTIALDASGVTAGTYQGLTVDSYGRVTSASDQGYVKNTDYATQSVGGVIKGGNWGINVDDTGHLYGSILSADSYNGYANKFMISKGTLNNVLASKGYATESYVDTAIDNLPEPMVFKGSLGTGGTITSLPTDGSANIGDTYKVITAGTYASEAADVGDTFICLTKTSSANTWELIPSGDEPSGTVTSVTIKATSPIVVDSSSAITSSGTRTLSHANSGVTAGTYKSVTVNATGHITGGTNPTTLSDYGITDAKIENGTITLGSNTITPLTSSSTLDATKLSGTIPSGCYTDNDTKNTAGTTNTTSKIYLAGATSQADNPQTYSNVNCYASGGKLYSNAKEVVTLSDSQALTNKTYNGYTLAAASAKAVDTSISAASTSTNLPTSQAVASFVEGKGYLTSEINSNLVNGSATGSLRTLDSHTGVIIGQGAFQQGYLTQAAGDYSHAEGYGCAAYGNYSHAEGYNTGALDAYQHVEGKWNIEDQTSLHIVGNGTAYGSESNAYTLDNQGNGWFAGDVYVGSTSGTNKDSGSVKLAKVSELPSAGTGINITNSVVTNTGVVNIETSPSAAGNGTIAVTKGTTSGTSTTYVSVRGLDNAAYKNVDTSISAASTSVNLPTSAAVASFVEGKGYTTNGIHSFYGTSAPGTVSGSVDGDIYIVIES